MLLEMPADILLSILVLLDAQDILLISQTCRGLHDFVTSSDYLWHQLLRNHLAAMLPLDIEPYVDPEQLPATRLQQIVTRALRVDHNWRKSNPRVKTLTRIGDMDNVCQIQFIGSHWIVAMHRSPPSLSVWRVDHPKQPFRTASIALLHSAIPFNFTATAQRGCVDALIAVICATNSGTHLSVYSVGLGPEMDDSSATFIQATPRVIYNTYRPASEGRFYEVHIQSQIIAVGIHSTLGPTGYRILFINSWSGIQCLVDPQWPDQFSQIHFAVYPQQLVLAGVRSPCTLVLRMHNLPSIMLQETVQSSRLASVSLGPPSAQYESLILADMDCILCADSTRNISYVSSISFHSLVRKSDDFIYHFPLSSPKEEFPLVQTFVTHPSASAEIVCLGQTGMRAIWLERRWTSDEYTLMKATFSPGRGKPVVEPLLGRHLALPFELHACQALAFDEARGRVCIAVHSGEVYILEF